MLTSLDEMFHHRKRLGAFVVASGLLAVGSAAASVGGGVSVSGKVRLAIPRESDPSWDLSNAVVYLLPETLSPPFRPPAEPLVVHQVHASFQPAFSVARKGQTVRFLNDDAIDHNVFSFSKVRKFDLGIYPKGESRSLVFDKTGPVVFFCSIHEYMNGIVFVVPNPWFSVTDAKGYFTIPDVPAGRYRVRTWHASLPPAVEFIEVRTLDIEGKKPVLFDIDLGKRSVREAAP